MKENINISIDTLSELLIENKRLNKSNSNAIKELEELREQIVITDIDSSMSRQDMQIMLDSIASSIVVIVNVMKSTTL